MARNWLSQIDEYEDGYSVDGSLFRTLSTLAYNIDLQFAPTITPYGTKISNLMVVNSYKIGRVATITLSYTLNGSFTPGEKFANIANAIAGYGVQIDPVTPGSFATVTINGYGINMAGTRTFRNQSFTLFVSAYYP